VPCSGETKEKLSIANSGKNHPMWEKFGKEHSVYGYRHTEEAKRKIGLASLGNKYALGQKGNISWNKEVSYSDETKGRISNSMIEHMKKSPKPWYNEDLLYKEYVENGKSFHELAKEWNTSCSKTLKGWARRFNIPIRNINEAMRLARQRFPLPTGEGAGMWKGGITPENRKIRTSLKMKEWRKSVFARDYYTCVRCLSYGGKLHVHHILPFADFPEERFKVDNGATLCRDCHHYVHSRELNILGGSFGRNFYFCKFY
ncbi:HNH endonuclease, partial [bacterium]|nr:HNH endonuclease [bacterium]